MLKHYLKLSSVCHRASCLVPLACAFYLVMQEVHVAASLQPEKFIYSTKIMKQILDNDVIKIHELNYA